MKFIPLFLVLGFLYACTYRGAFEGIQASNRIECSTLPPAQYDECMQDNDVSYDEYERERKQVLGQ